MNETQNHFAFSRRPARVRAAFHALPRRAGRRRKGPVRAGPAARQYPIRQLHGVRGRRRGYGLQQHPSERARKIDYSFEVLEAVLAENSVKAGDYFVVTLPAELTRVARFTPITSADGYELTVVGEDSVTYTIGYLTVTEDGVVTITFADDVEDITVDSASFTIEGDLLEVEISGGPPISFELWADGTIITIGFEEDPLPPEATVEKSGVYDPATNRITWTITVDSGDPEVTIEDVRVVDSLGEDQTYASCSLPSASVEESGGNHIFSLGSVTGTTSFTIVTIPTENAFGAEGSSQLLTNEADLYVGTFPDPIDTASAQVTVTTDWIKKAGVVRTVGGVSYIDWTITLNNNNRTIPASSTVSDTLPNHLLMDLASVLRNGKPVTTYPGDTAALSGQNFTYTLGSAAEGIQTITFTTQVLDAYYTQQNQTGFTNTASLNISSVPYTVTSPSVAVATSLVRKRGAGYDKATQLITWEIEINRNARTITGATVTETIGSNQLYYESFGIVRRDGSANTTLVRVANLSDVTSAPNQYYFDSANKKLTIYLGDLAAAAHPYLTFKTQVTNANHYANNYSGTYYNGSVTLKGGGVTDSSSNNATQTVASTVLAKRCAHYDYATKTFSWEITLNQNQMHMPDATVTELIQPGQTYVAGSLRIDGDDPGAKLLIDAAGTTLTVRLGEINRQTVITFDTVVANWGVFLTTNGDVTFPNTALLTSGIAGAPTVSVTPEFVVPNKPIVKTILEDFTEATGYIGWGVFINPNQAPMMNARLSDRLQEGLELDNESVVLYYWNQDAAGVMSLGDKVDAALYSFTYDYSTRIFIIDLPDGAQGYRLDFKTDVTRKGRYSNTISLTGAYNDSDGAMSDIYVTDAALAAAGSGRNGSITVTKTDLDGNVITAPAEFELLDSSGNVKQTLTTVDGRAVFQRLKLRTYYIREKKAPLGYALDTSSYPVTIYGTGETLSQTLSVANEPLTAAVILHKADENGDPLSGGLFRIFRASDTAFAAPLQSVASAGGVIRFENLAPGDYIVREIEAPLGYKVWTSGVPVSLVMNAAANTLPDAEIVEPIADELLTASVILHKAGETGKALSGGLFGIFRAADTAFATPLQSVASAGGVIRFDNLTPSDYVVRELEAPFGYEVWESDVPVSLVVDPATNTMPDTKSRRRSSTCAFALPSCCIRRTNTTARSAAARSRSSPLPTRRSQRRCRASPQ